MTVPQTEDDLRQLAAAWLAYQAWACDHPEADDSLELADAHGFEAWETAVELVSIEPELAWRLVLLLVEMAPDDDLLGNVAAGPFEQLLCDHARRLIERVEERAADDAKFRRCLHGVWGWYSIPPDIQRRLRAVGWGPQAE
jgi:hypothetical protein